MSDLRVIFPAPCDQPWEAMVPSGCHRACAKCDRVVHDLSQHDVAEVEQLLREEPGNCARARIDAFGVVATKPDRYGSVRRIVAAVGISTGILISPPVLARDKHIGGSIVGTVETYGFKTTVIAKDENGNLLKAKVRSNGKYKIKNVPPGTYSLEISGCASWNLEGIVVGQGEVPAPDPSEHDGCIVVGLLKLDDGKG